MNETVHAFRSPIEVARELWMGRSLYRALFHMALRQHEVGGQILDLGSKTRRQPYYSYVRVSPDSKVVATDLRASEEVVAVDVEKRFPFTDDEFDAVIVFNLLEHVFGFGNVPRESYRVLKPRGRAFVMAPFLYEYHPDPQDYFRFTDTALRQSWESSNFRCIWMEAIGEGIVTNAATQLALLGLPSFLRGPGAAAFYVGTTLIDRIIDALRPPVRGKRTASRYALGHLAVFEKP
jgi:SAM-dependent methyltransferase